MTGMRAAYSIQTLWNGAGRSQGVQVHPLAPPVTQALCRNGRVRSRHLGRQRAHHGRLELDHVRAHILRDSGAVGVSAPVTTVQGLEALSGYT